LQWSDSWERTIPSIKLFALTDEGASLVDAPEALINDELPPELREVFFTDGDRALSFIQSDVTASTKRDRVQRAAVPENDAAATAPSVGIPPALVRFVDFEHRWQPFEQSGRAQQAVQAWFDCAPKRPTSPLRTR
jgi:hypothetical protein